MDEKSKHYKIGFISALTLLFIILKLFKIITWSWLWVVSPLWITCLISAVAFAIILIAGRIKKGSW